MDNGQGEIAAIYTPTANNELCDGFWHRIKGLLHFCISFFPRSLLTLENTALNCYYGLKFCFHALYTRTMPFAVESLCDAIV